MFVDKTLLINAEQALPGRDIEMPVHNQHVVLNNPIKQPFSDNKNLSTVQLGLGCFWGAERKFWQLDGVYTTAVGYAGGYTKNPSYEEVCSGLTGHTEVVLVVYDESKTSFYALLKVFFEAHDPTQGMRQGNDRGTQYRSAIYCESAADVEKAQHVLQTYQQALLKAGYPEITTEIRQDQTFYYAEDYHQQYLAKNPNGYCGLDGTGIECIN